MSALIADFALAESAANLNISQVPLRRIDTVYAFNPLKDHGVTRAQYDSSIAFYIRNPELYKKVYVRVLERITESAALRDSTKK